VIALDASLLIAHFDPADAHHGGASQLLDDLATEPLIAHGLTLAEVLIGGVRVNRGTQMLADLHSIGVRLAPRDDGEPLRLAVLRVDTGLTLPDCCVLDIALSNGATLATFDDRLTRVAARLDVRVMPTP
jgi:predicted nucleic acid-binding protein